MKSIETCMILTGGRGSRLQTVVNDRPKPLADINGRPFLDFILDHLLRHDIKKVTLLTGYLGEMIESHYGSSYRDICLQYSLETTPLGTGGAIKNAIINTLHPNNKYLIVNGDTYFPANFKKLHPYLTEDKNVIFATHTTKSQRYGTLQVDTSSKKIINFLEKDESGCENLINAGAYFLNTQDILEFPQTRFSLENDFLPLKTGNSGNLYYIDDDAPFIDIGIPCDYARFRNLNE